MIDSLCSHPVAGVAASYGGLARPLSMPVGSGTVPDLPLTPDGEVASFMGTCE